MSTEKKHPETRYEAMYGRPLPPGYVEMAADVIERDDGGTLSEHERNILFRPPGARAPGEPCQDCDAD
jgi:hypothetical protein